MSIYALKSRLRSILGYLIPRSYAIHARKIVSVWAVGTSYIHKIPIRVFYRYQRESSSIVYMPIGVLVYILSYTTHHRHIDSLWSMQIGDLQQSCWRVPDKILTKVVSQIHIEISTICVERANHYMSSLTHTSHSRSSHLKIHCFLKRSSQRLFQCYEMYYSDPIIAYILYNKFNFLMSIDHLLKMSSCWYLFKIK